jgi:TolB-like protein/DNA-binding winged helix-turn-helix (wHTH) protein/Flp pilus assembly protein TadD
VHVAPSKETTFVSSTAETAIKWGTHQGGHSINRPKVIYEFGRFRLDREAHLLVSGEKIVALEPKAVEVLLILVEKRGELVPRKDLMSAVWPDTFVEESNLSSNISILRRQLGVTADGGDYIQTIPKRGYRFVAAVKQVLAEPVLLVSQDIASEAAPAVETGSDPLNQSAGMGEAGPTGTTTAASIKKPAVRPGIVLAAAAGLLASVLTLLYLAGWHWRLGGSGAEAHIDAIAVLPLENLSGDPAQEYFADGMTEALTADLAQIGALRVIARASVMQYKGAKQPLAQIAQRLNVEAVVSGSVLRSGNRVRITAALIRVATGQQLWAKTYERNLGDVLDLENEVARAIAGEVQAKVTAQEHMRLARNRSVNGDAYDAYLKGRYYYNRFTIDGFSKSIEYFEQSIKLDPDYATAYAGLADALASLEQIGAAQPEDVHPKALVAASKALAMDDGLPETHAAMASVRANDWEWSAAERESKRAIQLNPGFPLAHLYYSNMLRHLGRREESIAEARRALELDPLSPLTNEELADAHLSARQYDAAIEQYKKTLDLYPNQAAPRDSLGWAYVYEGKYDQGMEEIRKSIAMYGEAPGISPEIAFIYGITGRKGEAYKILNRLLSTSKTAPVAAHHFALIYVGMGKKDEAFAWLEKAYEQHSPMMAWLKVDQRFDSMRQDPRFEDLMRRVGLP